MANARQGRTTRARKGASSTPKGQERDFIRRWRGLPRQFTPLVMLLLELFNRDDATEINVRSTRQDKGTREIHVRAVKGRAITWDMDVDTTGLRVRDSRRPARRKPR